MKNLYKLAKLDFGPTYRTDSKVKIYIEQKLWDDYNECNDPYKRSKIRESIANLQPILSSYIDSTRYVIEKIYQNNRRFEEIEENGNNDNDYQQDFDGNRMISGDSISNGNRSDNDDYRDPPPTVF